MDLQRTDQGARRRKRWIIFAVAGLFLVGIAVAIARVKPAAPTIERELVWIDTVKSGPMVRQARGIGSLTPEEIMWIAARTEGRVERIVLRPGAQVTPDSIILILSNSEVVQAAADADSALTSAEAEVINLKAKLESASLAAESAAATAKADYEKAKLRAEMNERLFKNGLVPEIDLRLSVVTAQQARTQYEVERKRFNFARESVSPQLSVKRADVERLRAQAKLRHEELEALQVRAAMNGVLQS